MKCASGEAGLEILVGKLADLLEFVGFRVPQPDGRQGHAVECIGLYHRIMGLVEEGDPPSRSRAAGDSIVADDVPCPARSEEHTSALQSLMHIPFAVFSL